MSSLPRTDKSVLSNWWWAVDRLTVFALAVLIVCGIILVSSASPPAAERYGLPPFYFVHKQILFLIPTIGLMFGISLMNEKTLWRVSLVSMAVTIALMVGAIFFGPEVKGATRWISFHGISIQPSEFAKPFFAIISAWLIAKARQKPGFPGYQLSLGLFLVVISLMLMEPDLGMSFVLACMWGAQMFLSGLPMMVIAGLLGIGIAGLFCAYLFSPHVTSRIDRFLDPAAGNNYQVRKSLAAFSHGGFFGTGP
ncbi:MAG: FtsW/RodA/SpoVE family cell cycle protein, partial [Alphaproteobacteria bacterium]|nr:FtsW/RodA/SpoVE family cell cycle protein [Alphaproteobacteria bacterium]